MTIEENKALVRRFIDEVFLARRIEAVDELAAEDVVMHSPAGDRAGRHELTGAIERVSAGLSDATMSIEDVIAEGDRVAVRLTSRATQVGPFMGLPPSGRTYTIGEIHIFRIAGGEIAEHWHEADFLGMMRQLGAGRGSG